MVEQSDAQQLSGLFHSAGAVQVDEYRDKIAELLWEIEGEGRAARDGHPVLGIEAVSQQDPPGRQSQGL